MKGYKITEGQKNSIAVPQKFSHLRFNPVKDINGAWFIFEEEREIALQYFGWASGLVLEEYVPPIDDGDILFPTSITPKPNKPK